MPNSQTAKNSHTDITKALLSSKQPEYLTLAPKPIVQVNADSPSHDTRGQIAATVNDPDIISNIITWLSIQEQIKISRTSKNYYNCVMHAELGTLDQYPEKGIVTTKVFLELSGLTLPQIRARKRKIYALDKLLSAGEHISNYIPSPDGTVQDDIKTSCFNGIMCSAPITITSAGYLCGTACAPSPIVGIGLVGAILGSCWTSSACCFFGKTPLLYISDQCTNGIQDAKNATHLTSTLSYVPKKQVMM